MSTEACIRITDLDLVHPTQQAEYIASRLEEIAALIRQGYDSVVISHRMSVDEDVIVSLPYTGGGR